MATFRLPPVPSVRDIIKIFRLCASKQLSQNYLMDSKLTDKIVKYSGIKYGSQVLEIGPGPGSITRSIIKKLPKKLILVEKDKRFLPNLNILRDAFLLTNRNMKIIFDDIMNTDTNYMFYEEDKMEWLNECPNIYVIGNLPFSLSTALILKWLSYISEQSNIWINGRVQMTLTFQKEVAERLVAEITENQRCRLSVMAQTWTIPKLQFIIPRSAFVPKPEVDVAVVSFTPLKRPRTEHSFDLFEKVNRHLFSFRQKYCKKSAGTLFPPESRDYLSIILFKLAKVKPETRAVDLTVEDVSRLVSAYTYLCRMHPEIKQYNYRASRKVVAKKFIKDIEIYDTF